MWSHLAEQLRAKPVGHGAARQPQGCGKEGNKGLPAALPGQQEPRESPARHCGRRSKSWFVSWKIMCPVKFHLGRGSKVNGWELVSLQYRTYRRVIKIMAISAHRNSSPWFWCVLQSSVLWQEAHLSGSAPQHHPWQRTKVLTDLISGVLQSKRYFWLSPERSETDPQLTQTQGWLCPWLQCESTSKGKSCSLLPWKGCQEHSLPRQDFDGYTMEEAQTQQTILLRMPLKLYLPWQEPDGQSWCAPNWSDVIPTWHTSHIYCHFSMMLLSP